MRLCFPLYREDQVTGFLCLGDKKRGEGFTIEEHELLTTLCNQISLAVENARLLEQTLAVERQLYEAQRLSSLGLLSASIAHEVKNPLSSIKAITSVLQEELKDNATAAEDLHVVRSEIDRLTGVVERLLRFARPEQGDGHRDLVLKPIIDDIVLILSHEAEQQGVGIRSEVRADLVVSADPEDLKEVLFNLILNGIQATEAGEVTVSAQPAVDPGAEDASGTEPAGVPPPRESWVAIDITDNGPGIPDDVRAHIFEPFYTTRASGTGLGLAIVKRHVDRLGGQIDVRSGVLDGRGTVFTVRLPGGTDETENPHRR